MCLAIYKPKNATLSKQHLKNGFRANDDGAGFSISDGKTLTTYKGFFDFDSFYATFKPFNRAGVSAIVHFRFATHGAVNTDNCHPFQVSETISIIHNGVLAWRSNEKQSDTACFVADTLQPVANHGMELFRNPAFRAMTEKAIGDHNKMVMLSACGEVVILNEHKSSAHWANGAWWSNRGYESFSYPYSDEATPYSWAEKKAGAWGKWDDESDDYSDTLDDAEVCETCAIDLDAGAFDLADINARPVKKGHCHFCHATFEDDAQPII